MEHPRQTSFPVRAVTLIHSLPELHAALLGGMSGADVYCMSQVIYSIMRGRWPPAHRLRILAWRHRPIGDRLIYPRRSRQGPGVPPVTARIRPFAYIQSETNKKADNASYSL